MSRPNQAPKIAEEHNPRRSHARLRLGIAAVFETIEGKQKARMVDLSQGGAHLYVPNAGKVREGFLTWMNFEIFAVVVWQKGDEFGVEFDAPLTYEQLLRVRQEAPAVVQEEAMGAALAARDFVAGTTHIGVDS